MIHLIFAFVLSVIGSVAIDYYGRNYNEKELTPLPIYIGLLFMMAGLEISKFVG